MDKVTRDIDTLLQVADLRGVNSGQGSQNTNNLNFYADRTFTLGMMEHHEDTIFQYDVQPGWVVPWLNKTSIATDVVGKAEYPTDVVRFAHNCSWVFPQMEPNEADTVWIIDGQKWALWDKPFADFDYLGGE